MTARKTPRPTCSFVRAPVQCQFASLSTRSTCKHESGPSRPSGRCLRWVPVDLHVGMHDLSVAEHYSLCRASIRGIREWMALVSPNVRRRRSNYSWQAALALACAAREAIRFWDKRDVDCRAVRQEEERIMAQLCGEASE